MTKGCQKHQRLRERLTESRVQDAKTVKRVASRYVYQKVLVVGGIYYIAYAIRFFASLGHILGFSKPLVISEAELNLY
jgi:hypothetical protein